MKVVRLSAQRTGSLYTPGNIPGTHFCQRLRRPQGHSAAGRIISMKNSNDAIGCRTRNPPSNLQRSASTNCAIAYTCLFILHPVLVIQDRILPIFPARRVMSIVPPVHAHYLHIWLSYCLLHLVESMPNILFCSSVRKHVLFSFGISCSLYPTAPHPNLLGMTVA